MSLPTVASPPEIFRIPCRVRQTVCLNDHGGHGVGTRPGSRSLRRQESRLVAMTSVRWTSRSIIATAVSSPKNSPQRPERLVAGDDHAGSFVTGGDELEEQAGDQLRPHRPGRIDGECQRGRVRAHVDDARCGRPPKEWQRRFGYGDHSRDVGFEHGTTMSSSSSRLLGVRCAIDHETTLIASWVLKCASSTGASRLLRAAAITNASSSVASSWTDRPNSTPRTLIFSAVRPSAAAWITRAGGRS